MQPLRANGTTCAGAGARPARSICSTAARKRQPEALAGRWRADRSTSTPGPDRADRLQGQPDFVPIIGTQLLWASNTTNDVLHRHQQQQLLRADVGPLVPLVALTDHGRSSPATHCRATSRAFRRLARPAAVLPTVAGTAQAQEALISNSIPQTATVPLSGGPSFTPELRRAAAVFADRRHAADLRRQLLGAADPRQ